MHGAPSYSSSHAAAAHAEWSALQKTLSSAATSSEVTEVTEVTPNTNPGPIQITGNDLTIADVVAVSLHKSKACLSNKTQQVDDSVAFLADKLNAGHIVYGVNTGFGGSADTRTQHFERLQMAAVQHLNVGVLLQTDKGNDRRERNELLRSHALPIPLVRAAMLIRCNSLMRGHSGVRVSVIDSIMKLLDRDMAPVVPLRGSISASGDLSTLSYIAGTVEGNPDIYVRVGTSDTDTNTTNNNILPANEALKLAGIEPVRLQAKEGLGITNGTAPSCATAAIVVHQANQLAVLTQLLTAMGTEALAGTAHNYDPFISAIRPHPGQAEVASNIRRFLAGSKISPDRDPSRIGLAQDRYALRTAPQWIGPQLEDLLLATRQVSTEINSTTDNPLIDVAGQAIHHGGNFQAMALTSAMEKTMTALQNLGRLLFAQSSELVNNMTNKGLPPNLSFGEPSECFTAKGFDVNMAAYLAELAYLAHPVSTHVQVAEMTNQSVNSMALVAGRYALEAVEVLSLMAATYLYELCQALDLRVLQIEFRKGLADNVVAPVLRKCFGGDYESVTVEKWAETIIQRWDQLSHLDTADRARVAVEESLGVLMGLLTVSGPTPPAFADLVTYKTVTTDSLASYYKTLQHNFLERPMTTDYISPASRVVYEFVRKELGVPLNRGVEDHPPFKLAAAEAKTKQVEEGVVNGHVNGHNTNGEAATNGMEKKLANKDRILGTMAGEIYEAIRSGELHSRIMKFGEEAGIWG